MNIQNDLISLLYTFKQTHHNFNKIKGKNSWGFIVYLNNGLTVSTKYEPYDIFFRVWIVFITVFLKIDYDDLTIVGRNYLNNNLKPPRQNVWLSSSEYLYKSVNMIYVILMV